MYKNIKIANVGLIVSTVLMILVILSAITSYSNLTKLESVESLWNRFNAENSNKFHIIRDINEVIGYGGMIHQYKNYLLRNNPADLKQAQKSLNTVQFLLHLYESYADDEEIEALNSVTINIIEYEKKLALIEQLILSGSSIQQIDQQVKINDEKALKGLLLLQHKSSKSGTEGVKDNLFGSKTRLINWLRNDMGYSGLIHYYKNLIIRQDEDYYDLALESINSAEVAIDYYLGLNNNQSEIKSINQILSVINLYKNNLETIVNLIEQGLSPEQIDQLVIINDKPAYQAFTRLNKFIDYQNASHALEATKTLLELKNKIIFSGTLIAMLLLMSLILISWLFFVKIIWPIGSLTQILQRLATGNLTTPVDVEIENTEIGEMAKAIKVLKENSRDRLRQTSLVKRILDSAGEGIYGVNTKGKVTFINKKAIELLGWKGEHSLLGQDIHSLCHYQKADGNPYPAIEFPSYVALHNNITQLSSEEIFWKKNGESFHVQMITSSLLENDRSSGAVVVFQDITERKRIDKMKTEFISTVSHELRTPLTSIRGSLGLVTGGAAGEISDKVTNLLTIASNNTERLMLLINDILDIEKIEAGAMSFKFETIELKPFMEQVIQDNNGYAQQHHVEFVLTKVDKDATIFADVGRLMQVMANLLSNAAKFSDDNGKVEISVECIKHKMVRISVKDYGMGIPEVFQPKLFEKFTQSDASDTKQKGGTGLGLSITKAIIEKLNGQISFVSSEGKGTTFHADFPVQNIDIKAPHSDSKTTEKILIIEDNEDVATLLRMMLLEGGYKTDTAYTVQQARDLLQNNQSNYIAITLDLMLPDESGIDYLQELRQNTISQNIPVIVVSAKADDTKQELKGGVVAVAGWLNKPIDEVQLLNTLEGIKTKFTLPEVLHVEDDSDVHEIISQILKGKCKLTRAVNLQDSKQKLKSQKFDLVLLDIGLPDGSGLELLEQIETFSLPPKVVIFSAQDVDSQFSDRVNGVLVKSKIDDTYLLNTICSLIKKEN